MINNILKQDKEERISENPVITLEINEGLLKPREAKNMFASSSKKDTMKKMLFQKAATMNKEVLNKMAKRLEDADGKRSINSEINSIMKETNHYANEEEKVQKKKKENTDKQAA